MSDSSLTICIGDQSPCEGDDKATNAGTPEDTLAAAPQGEPLNGQARHAGNAEARWTALTSFPDFWQVGDKIVGFDSSGPLGNPVNYSPNVITAGQRTYWVGDLCQGTESNVGSGVGSGTSQGSGHVLFLTGHDNVKANGQPVVRDGSECMVNCNAAGAGGAKGYVHTNTESVNSQPEESSEPLSEAERFQQQGEANLERVGELRDALHDNPNGKTAAEAEALYAEVEQLVGETRAQQDALMDALREGRISGNDYIESSFEVDEAANRAADMQQEAERQVRYTSERGRNIRAAGVFMAEAATPYGIVVDIQDTMALWGEVRLLAASGMTLLTAASVIPGVGLLRKADDVVDIARNTDRAGDTAGSANRSGASGGSSDGLRVASTESSTVTYRGGPHSQTRKPVGDGLDSHHLPPDSVSPIPRERGPAIQMDPMDHRATSSHGIQGLSGAEYRAEVGQLIQEGRMRDAMALEIRDVRRAAYDVSGNRMKYNRAVQEMLEYSRNNGLIDKR
ncbi:hypothetical protein FRY77_21210 [Halomonas sp. MG34]|nr:hypothetical protein [Halomonas sp. MG34]